jgi:hypothetical protein
VVVKHGQFSGLFLFIAIIFGWMMFDIGLILELIIGQIR